MDIDKIVKGVLKGKIRSIAKAITFVEDNPSKANLIIDCIFEKTGKAKVIGITGSPGAGKSTLTDKIARKLSEKGFTVGIIAIDPSSPFSGGAVLGDRVRMNSLSSVEGVYIRSMATRGMLGGLSRACLDAVDILDAAGFNFIIVETVGVGQDEVDIFRVSDINILVLVPGMGDDIQALKAGIMEIADVFVINKSDRDGVDKLVAILNHFNAISEKDIPVFKTVAITGEGLDNVVEFVIGSIKERENTGSDKRKFERLKYRVLKIVQDRVIDIVENKSKETLESKTKTIVSREKTPYQVAEELMELLCK